ncbi:Fructose import ATP-binding protein FruK [Rhizobium rhizogenes]|uniref:Fructose import ATP-binding protein FruK n=1 Tax=Rhizobium rhizogenes TaxID=359 RepID=A0AAN2DFM2_RHIRH|nr:MULTISPECIES: sugar ABC transporter ATP-binding protein [Rhizobium/Agrobacterium group]AQS63735.1 sugar ABC transporter ATP-binding protein [Rhizobium rhizogenes]MCZ7440964.1 sugar ABC transporter ATP-binding protein [Rhizobium rhizogenes]NSZ82015.1 sugar ABC transporter ATP-binding protein [Agrobacterium tumefaciens]OAM62959.1 sugar ABC transporter ATP-binding protein [Rhizobium rhizogenes]CAD0216302.1 Fructose import ATP-binding protein FruK [Rhizobium rhizogenes]
MSETAPLLEARAIGKSFLGITALDGVDFSLGHGEIHALLGENGAGKSTLIKILTGVYHRDSGSIFLEGSEISPTNVGEAQVLGIGTVYQEVNLLENLTVAENLFLGRQPRRFGLIDRSTMQKNSQALLAQYGLSIDVNALLSSYSVAIRQIIAIARAVDLSGKVLVLDEPTASLDAHEVETLFGVLRNLRARGIGIVIITHFLNQVYDIADRVTVLRNGRLVGTRDIGSLPRSELISMMLGRELQHITHEHQATEDTVAEGEPPIRFEGYGKRGSIAPFDLGIRPGEIVGVAGLLGSGRTETAFLLFGIDRPDTGKAVIDGQTVAISSPEAAITAGFGFCPEERKTDGIIGDFSVTDNIALALQARQGWARPLSRRQKAELAESFIKSLDIRPADPNRPIKFLSGGNQQKAILARWLATHPRLLILDEPTRGIDIGAHAEILKMIEKLCSEGMSLVVISSELEELTAVAHRVVVLSDRRHVSELKGGDVTADNIMRAIADAAKTEAA